VIYDTMWHSTEIMAEAIAEALGEEGVHAEPIICAPGTGATS